MAIMGSYTYLLLLEYLFFITSESIKSESALKRQKFVLAGVGLRTNCRYRKRSWTKILKFQLLIFSYEQVAIPIHVLSLYV